MLSRNVIKIISCSDRYHLKKHNARLPSLENIPMEKIMMIFDGRHFSQSAFNFALHLHELRPALFTGVFTPSKEYEHQAIYNTGPETLVYNTIPDVAEEKMMQENVEQFKSLSEKNGIPYRVHENTEGSILDHIRLETRYSDILILSAELYYANLGKKASHRYMRDAIHHAECPVLVLPELCPFPKSVVLAYDGSASSVFAIKQFAHLFPDLAQSETILVFSSERTSSLPDFDYIKEYAANHYTSLSFLKLDLDPTQYFNTWINETGPAILISGAYSRTRVSELFKKSFVSEMIKEHKLPVFISHK